MYNYMNDGRLMGKRWLDIFKVKFDDEIY